MKLPSTSKLQHSQSLHFSPFSSCQIASVLSWWCVITSAGSGLEYYWIAARNELPLLKNLIRETNTLKLVSSNHDVLVLAHRMNMLRTYSCSIVLMHGVLVLPRRGILICWSFMVCINHCARIMGLLFYFCRIMGFYSLHKIIITLRIICICPSCIGNSCLNWCGNFSHCLRICSVVQIDQ